MEKIITDSMLNLLDKLSKDDELLEMYCLLTPSWVINAMFRDIKE